MVTTKRRSPTSTLVSKGAISSASSILEDLPEKPKEIWSLREAIDLLKEPISAALDRGYSYAEVSKMLTEKGVEISPSTLKYYLSSARREKDGSKPKTRRRRKTQGITLNPETVTLANGTANGAAATLDEEEAPAKRTRVITAAKTKTTAKTPAKAAATKAKTTSTKAAPKAPSTRGRKKAAE
ncbi:hypothetical protein [Phormidesmis priestleyi]|uniref:hypothetical protein n=1 Tax=Phormidesmis priestleyi TaxID=268141 RepID=UPI00083B9198|nr:hypothetical protein [Phormidesmis priestleyi]